MPPIKPHEINKQFPEAVFTAFNNLIIKNFSGFSAFVNQKDVLAEMESLGINKKDVWENQWLNVEEAYKNEGWDVEYHKPFIDEAYEPYFVFTKKNQDRTAKKNG